MNFLRFVPIDGVNLHFQVLVCQLWDKIKKYRYIYFASGKYYLTLICNQIYTEVFHDCVILFTIHYTCTNLNIAQNKLQTICGSYRSTHILTTQGSGHQTGCYTTSRLPPECLAGTNQRQVTCRSLNTFLRKTNMPKMYMARYWRSLNY